MLHDVKRKILEIRRKQRIGVMVVSVGIVFYVIGVVLVNFTLILGYFSVVGLLVSLLGVGIWVYYSTQKTKTIKELKNYLAIEQLKTRSGEHEDWELIQELLSD
jgi:hypothetical protein